MNSFTLARQTCKLWNIIEPIGLIDGQDVLLQLDVKWRFIVIKKHLLHVVGYGPWPLALPSLIHTWV